MGIEDNPPPILQAAQQQSFSRSDVATTKRALQDLTTQTKKLQDAIWQIAATQQECTKEAFEDAWKKRGQLNEVNRQLASIGQHLEATLPRVGAARLTEREKTEIKGLYQSGLYTQSQLAEQYGVTQPTISDITKS
ncbi:hypothetical protein [Paraburkholderia caribensis]|uniref:hypothetical protein n=1 Tax=Paraburkholderia caribensis TaxID=75105 RepID=UPI00078DA8D7|nr:hypothetical protein [Paraburkholderia caribensis]AMV47828.1 hypothetical protein ATN79_44995 [Paraburkholderia caribensis]